MTTSLNVKAIRKLFPILQPSANSQPLVYLDNAATTQKPLTVIQAINDYYQNSNANVHRASHQLSTKATLGFEKARQTVQQFINASTSAEVIWTRGATEAINLVAYSYGYHFIKAGDEILITSLEHHANIVPWQQLAKAKGAKLKVVSINEAGELNKQDFSKKLSKKTKLVCLSHISNAIGTINPIHQLIQEAHDAGALVLVDAAQSAAHTKLDVQTLSCDFLVFSGHKLYGPTGIGVLYAKRALLDMMPPWQMGGEMIEQVTLEDTRFNCVPFKFEAGTPNIAGAFGLASAIEFINQLDLNQVKQHEIALASYAESLIQHLPGIRFYSKANDRIGIISFLIKGHHPQDIGLLLDQKGIAVRVGHHCAMPLMQHLNINGTIRASFAVYNTTQEVEQFANALADICQPATMVPTHIELASSEQNHVENNLIKKLLSFNNWDQRYRHLMQLGKQLSPWTDQQKTDDKLVPGCESRVWLEITYQVETNQFSITADSDARIMKGLLALAINFYDGQSPDFIENYDITTEFSRIGLDKHLSPSRANGLIAIINRIKHEAGAVNSSE
ncbi:SufS family cysteine desulfurase [Spartinivicinus poritis]|uniref:cysteine desulfurase n=1 Tax=Spartinivicinus poritis TaxID=2994640 RepID=A0ABT5UJC4_9GAMM|nr:SufS family cysteine desulfurase [Spartinivicinus sp. A2-2]MDE1465149.1 SufS family cysteine desulfurase [Spartinivicinus sp. A2-2]